MVAKIRQTATTSDHRRCVLTLAGSDPSGAAGIQADLKTFAAFGVHGLSAITAVTAQNLREVTAILQVPPAHVRAQLQALRADFRLDAIKIGMLGSRAHVDLAVEFLRESRARHVVLDPVLVSSSGRRLLSRPALARMREHLLPLIDVLTPNLPEAQALLGRELATPTARRQALRELLALGPRAVLLKGGHASGTSVRDYYADSATDTPHTITHARLAFEARGTGCTLAAAIAAGLALGLPMLTAVRRAEAYLQRCFRHAWRSGRAARRVLDHTQRS